MKRLFAPLLLAALVGASLATIAAVLLGTGSTGSSTSTVGSGQGGDPGQLLLRGDPPRGIRIVRVIQGADGDPDLPAGLHGRRRDQGGDLRRRGRGHGDRAQRTRA